MRAEGWLVYDQSLSRRRHGAESAERAAFSEPRAARVFFSRVCAWRWGKRGEPDLPSRRDPRCRCSGYSRLIGEADETASLGRLKALHGRVIDPKTADPPPPGVPCFAP